jgi:preprotein translocase subunit SecY
MLAIFRLGHWIPLPGVNQDKLAESIRQQVESGSAAGKAISFVTIFGGGAFGHSTIFGLGIMPYITAGIIFQLIASVSPRMKALQQEGPTGRQKIAEWTRLATIGLCIIQGIGWLKYIQVQGLVYQQWAANPIWWVMAVGALTAGCLFLMWLGEQIDKFGIGNGVSLIIAAGILARMPNAITDVYKNFDPAEPGKMGYPALFFLFAGFVLVVGGSVIMTVAQRRIPIQQAKHTRGRKVFGGQKSYLPLRINHGGVMPVIFASSLMIFPSVIFSLLAQQAKAAGADSSTWGRSAQWLSDQFGHGQFP